MENESISSDQFSDGIIGDNANMDKYNAYRQYEKEYNDKVNCFIAAYAAAQNDPAALTNWPSTGIKYTDEIYEAMQRWEELGFKNEMEALLNAVDSELDLEHEEENRHPI
jgi:hypothetical protein